MHEFLWFLGGAVTYKLLSIFLGLTQIARVIQQLQFNVVIFLGTVLEDIAYIKALKYKTMAENDVSPFQINKAREQDEQFFEEWKKSCIEKIHSSVPNYVKLSFDNWEESMTILNRVYRNSAREKEKR